MGRTRGRRRGRSRAGGPRLEPCRRSRAGAVPAIPGRSRAGDPRPGLGREPSNVSGDGPWRNDRTPRRDRGRRSRNDRRQPGSPPPRRRRSAHRGLRAGPARLLLRLRHPVLGRRRRRLLGRPDRPNAGAAPRTRHRRPAPARGGRDRSGSARGGGPRPGRRRRGARGLRPADDRHRRRARSGRTCRASTPRACTACRPWTTARPCATRWTDAGADPKRAVVVGGGYIGVEMAEAMVRARSGRDPARACRAADVRPSTRTWARSSHKAMEGLGIDVRSGVAVEGLEAGPDGRVRAAVDRRAGVRRPTSWCSVSGSRPNTALAEEAGLPMGGPAASSPTCGCGCRKHDGIWAGGDCVETVHRVTGQPVLDPARHAREQAGPGGRDQPRRRVRDVPRRGRHRGQQGLRPGGRPDRADARGRPSAPASQFVTATIESDQPGRLLPGRPADDGQAARRERHRAAAGRADRRQEGAAKRIDVLAVALWNEMTVDEMIGLDLGYAPPFAPVWDPVLVAARKAWTPAERDRAQGRARAVCASASATHRRPYAMRPVETRLGRSCLFSRRAPRRRDPEATAPGRTGQGGCAARLTVLPGWQCSTGLRLFAALAVVAFHFDRPEPELAGAEAGALPADLPDRRVRLARRRDVLRDQRLRHLHERVGSIGSATSSRPAWHGSTPPTGPRSW